MFSWNFVRYGMGIHQTTKSNRAYLQEYYLNRIVALFDPELVWLTGTAAEDNMHAGSDFDFIVESHQPLDADAIIGAIDIIPRRYATREMMKKAILLYKKEENVARKIPHLV
jgi:hypothetical protein